VLQYLDFFSKNTFATTSTIQNICFNGCSIELKKIGQTKVVAYVFIFNYFIVETHGCTLNQPILVHA
jgi:hypothetical protein